MSYLQIILPVIFFGVLFILFLYWLLNSQIIRATRRLQQLNQQNLEKEKVLKEELARAKRQAESEIEQGKAEAKSIKEQARDDAERQAKDILELARKEAKRIVNEGQRDSQRKHKDLLLQMRDQSVFLAMDIIRYIFSERGKENLQIQLADELISQIDELKKEQIKAEGNSVEIVSAFALKDKQKDRLQHALSSKLKRNIKLIQTEDKDIIAGLVIKLGRFVLDGSIKNKLSKILPLIKERAKEPQG